MGCSGTSYASGMQARQPSIRGSAHSVLAKSKRTCTAFYHEDEASPAKPELRRC